MNTHRFRYIQLGIGFYVALACIPIVACSASSPNALVQRGEMTQAIYDRLADMGRREMRYHVLSDVDVRWALGLLDVKPPIDSQQNRDTLHIDAVSNVTTFRHLTEFQRAMVFDACMRLFSSKSQWDTIEAMTGLGQIHDRRAVPIIRRLAVTNPPSSPIGKYARQSLRDYFHISVP